MRGGSKDPWGRAYGLIIIFFFFFFCIYTMHFNNPGE